MSLPALNSKQSLGSKGESLAAAFLQSQGYHIIERNFKARYGELDVIATKGNVLVFIEVKTRRSLTFGRPEEAITKRKLHELILTSQYYTLLHPEFPKQQRMDLVAITLTNEQHPQIHHLKNITL